MKKISTILVLFAIAIAFVSPLLAAEPSLKSLLVSIEKYELAPLDYAEKDVAALATLLMSRYGSQAQACIDSAALTGQSGPDLPRRSIMGRIENWCSSLNVDDTAILYLAGHGVKDADGKLYLAMINFDRKNFDSAAIPLEWIRLQFGNCKGKSKLLLIDTCFAGTGKNIDFEQVNSEEFSDSFADLKDVVTIASCRGGEKSWLWGEMKHSLFTYWVIEALKGNSDADNDQIITCNELVKYLQQNVSWVAQRALDKEQKPTVLNAEAGKDFRLPLRAVGLSQLIENVAEQIDLQMRLEKFTRIGVPEFTTGMENSFDPQYGALSRLIAANLRSALTQKSSRNRSGYEVLGENALREALQSKGITPDDLGTEKTKNLNVGGEELPMLLGGRLLLREPAGLSISTELLDTNGKTEVGHARGTALLNKSDLALMGVSGKFAISSNSSYAPPSYSTSYKPTPIVGLVSQSQQLQIDEVVQESKKKHPLADAENPYQVWIETRPMNKNRPYIKRDFVIDGNDCYLPLSNGEEYQIKVRNKSGSMVFVRILVDGLNTLSQKMPVRSKGAVVEAVDAPEGEYEFAPRVSLEEARAWVSEPGREWAIAGFVDANHKTSTMQRFQIVDADESVAARKSYSDQIGLITVAFYNPVPPNARGIGTGAGNSERVRIEYYKGSNVPGKMIAVYNIRYMTPEALSSR